MLTVKRLLLTAGGAALVVSLLSAPGTAGQTLPGLLLAAGATAALLLARSAPRH